MCVCVCVCLSVFKVASDPPSLWQLPSALLLSILSAWLAEYCTVIFKEEYIKTKLLTGLRVMLHAR